MTTLTRVKQATSEFIKVLRYGKSDVQTALNCLPHGLDSKPVKEKLAIHIKTSNNSESVIVGYIDKSTNTNEGETRIYATDSSGTEVFSLYFKNNGTVEFGGNTDNLVRYSVLKSEYDKTKEVVDIISNTLKTWVTAPGDGGAALKAAYISAIGAKVTGNISGSKINEIKTI